MCVCIDVCMYMCVYVYMSMYTYVHIAREVVLFCQLPAHVLTACGKNGHVCECVHVYMSIHTHIRVTFDDVQKFVCVCVLVVNVCMCVRSFNLKKTPHTYIRFFFAYSICLDRVWDECVRVCLCAYVCVYIHVCLCIYTFIFHLSWQVFPRFFFPPPHVETVFGRSVYVCMCVCVCV